MSSILTYSGRMVRPLALRAEDVCVEDVAHALSLKCRFGGNTRTLYSVAQHSVYVAGFCDPQDALAGLLHDAAEAYLTDLPSPIKGAFHVMTEDGLLPIAEVEDRILGAIFEAAGRRWTGSLPAGVKEADGRLLATEARDLRGVDLANPGPHWHFSGEPVPWLPDPDGRKDRIEPWSARKAELVFLHVYRHLGGRV